MANCIVWYMINTTVVLIVSEVSVRVTAGKKLILYIVVSSLGDYGLR